MHNRIFADVEKSGKVVHVALKRPAAFVQLYKSQRVNGKNGGQEKSPPADLGNI